MSVLHALQRSSVALKRNWMTRWHYFPMKTCCRCPTLALETLGLLKPLLVKRNGSTCLRCSMGRWKQKRQLGRVTSEQHGTEEILRSGLGLWGVLQLSSVCGITKKAKNWFGYWHELPPISKVRAKTSSQKRNKAKASHWKGLNWSLAAWRWSFFTSYDEYCYFMFICCDVFNHVLAVSTQSGVLVSTSRWIVQNQGKGEKTRSLYKNIS